MPSRKYKGELMMIGTSLQKEQRRRNMPYYNGDAVEKNRRQRQEGTQPQMVCWIKERENEGLKEEVKSV